MHKFMCVDCSHRGEPEGSDRCPECGGSMIPAKDLGSDVDPEDEEMAGLDDEEDEDSEDDEDDLDEEDEDDDEEDNY